MSEAATGRLVVAEYVRHAHVGAYLDRVFGWDCVPPIPRRHPLFPEMFAAEATCSPAPLAGDVVIRVAVTYAGTASWGEPDHEG